MNSPFVIVVAAIILGTMLDAIIKFVAVDLSVLTLTTWRFIFGSVLAVGICWWRKTPMPSGEAVRFHLMRGGVQLITALSFFFALTQLALAEATTIGFTATLIVPFAARLILGERISYLAIGAGLVGFLGAAFAVSASGEGAPEDGNRLLGAMAAGTAALGYALVLVLLRLRTRSEDKETIALFGNLVPALYLLVLMAVVTVSVEGAPGFAINSTQTVWIMILGAAGFSIWWLMSVAYSQAEAQKLAPFEYVSLPASVLVGWLLFGEEPHWRFYIGAMVIIAACLIVALEHRLFPGVKRAA